MVQEVFVQLARNPGRLDRVRRPRSYLLKIAQNVAAKLVGRRRGDVSLDQVPELVVSERQTEDMIDGIEVCRSMLGLPPEQRIVVYLRHFTDLTFWEIGGICNVSLFTAASRSRLAGSDRGGSPTVNPRGGD